MNDDINLVDVIKKRQKYKISQTKLAKYSGFTSAKISAWEKNKNIPTDSQIETLNSCLEKIIYEIENKNLNITKKNIVKETKKIDYKIPKIINDSNEYYTLLNARKLRFDIEYKNTLTKLYNRMKKNKNKTSPVGIALFSGCGGLTAGFEAAGYNIVGHVEIEDSANKIYSQNFPNSELLQKDICDITKEEIDLWKMRYGNIDVVIGGPPCQGFSLAGKRNPNDARNQLYKKYAEVVNYIRPKVFVMENVYNMTTMRDSDGVLFIDKIKEIFDIYGYKLNINLINAKNFGVPESRERVIIIGTKKEYELDFVLTNTNKKEVTFRDATSDLKEIESAEKSDDPLHWAIAHPQHVIEWLKNVPEGHSAHENEDKNLRPPSGFNTTYKRIFWDQPCSTISTNFSMISGARNVHPKATRSFTIREAARVQSFPDQFVFVGNWGDIRKAIGNAVPPLLAEAIANQIKNLL